MCAPLLLPVDLRGIEKESRILLYGMQRRDAIAFGRLYSLDPLAQLLTHLSVLKALGNPGNVIWARVPSLSLLPIARPSLWGHYQ